MSQTSPASLPIVNSPISSILSRRASFHPETGTIIVLVPSLSFTSSPIFRLNLPT
uniref:Uncharacterized protein n=1 Tax=Calypogeia fissa associated deltaflexivirus TaxID=2933106 RepID=A0A9C7GWJ2_9VIRU|nr:hypothetical protein 1 [Calypogeia fissa associated deltaflexivirus]CAI5383916.1 hypothetical protein 1 [Calypogeia fissa associated deltaflexivirus]